MEKLSPLKESNRITRLLDMAWSGTDRFPVNVKSVALDLTHSFNSDPITLVKGNAFNGIDGVLARHPNQKEWAILYNDSITHPGRVNFTLAHELGHYMLHRRDLDSDRFECGEQDMRNERQNQNSIEKEANAFAANLLMPLNDFRQQVEGQSFSFDLMSHCADRYGSSLTATALRWIEMSPKRAVLVASCDGFMKWASSTKSAYKSGAFFATRSNILALPPSALAVREETPAYGSRQTVPAYHWFPTAHPDVEVIETIVATEQYDYTLTLLQLPDMDAGYDTSAEDELVEDSYDRFIRNGQVPY